jgi:histone H3/H4
MPRLQITCINKADRQNPHERIQNVGGAGFKFSQPDAIKCIEQRLHSFYVSVGGNTVNVIIATHNGNKYIKTENDGIQPDNLLKLPECR